MKLKTTSIPSLSVGAALLALWSGAAQAQSAACEEFKNKLAARVDPSITAFTLEVVKNSAPTPPGAKVFGTCDGGAYKVLFRRGGDSRPAPAAASASAAPAPASAPAPAPAPQVAAKPVTPAPPPPSPAPKPAVVPAPPPPAPARPVAGASAPSPAASLAQKPPVPASAPAAQPAKPVAMSASPVVVARAPEPSPPAPLSATTSKPLDEASIVKALPAVESDAETGFVARNWQWLAGLLLLPLAGGLWAWRVHRSAYDEAGLPRGPKL